MDAPVTEGKSAKHPHATHSDKLPDCSSERLEEAVQTQELCLAVKVGSSEKLRKLGACVCVRANAILMVTTNAVNKNRQ